MYISKFTKDDFKYTNYKEAKGDANIAKSLHHISASILGRSVIGSIKNV